MPHHIPPSRRKVGGPDAAVTGDPVAEEYDAMIAVVALAGLLALGVAPAQAGVTGRYRGPGDPWAIGYGSEVARSCPGWSVYPQATLHRRGILPLIRFGDEIAAMDSPFSRELGRGIADAIADQRRHAGFCTHVRTIAGKRWARLAPVIVPTP